MTEGIDQLIYNDEFPGLAYNKFTGQFLWKEKWKPDRQDAQQGLLANSLRQEVLSRPSAGLVLLLWGLAQRD